MKKSSASNPGQRSSLTAIAKLAGVSTATVSRALNGHPNVREETRLRIERIADEWGYLPSAAARSLSRSKNDIIGFILPQVESGFYASLLAGIDEASRARGYHLITALSHGDHRELHPGIRLVRERRIDGLLLLDSCRAQCCGLRNRSTFRGIWHQLRRRLYPKMYGGFRRRHGFRGCRSCR